MHKQLHIELKIFLLAFIYIMYSYDCMCTPVVITQKPTIFSVDTLNEFSYSNRRNNPKLSLEYAIKAYSLSKDIDYEKGLAFAIHNRGTAKAVLGRFDIGIVDLIEASRIREKIGDYEGLAYTYNNIGYVFSEMGNDIKAIEYYEKALDLFQQIELKRDFGILLNNIGHVYYRNGNFEKALSYFQKALIENQENDDERGVGASKSNIGMVYSSIGEFNKGLKYQNEALEIGNRHNDKYGTINTLRNISENYLKLKQIEKAKLYATRSLLLSQEIGSLGEEKTSARLLAEINETIGDNKETVKYLKQESRLKDSIFDIEKAEVLSHLQSLYELESKSNETDFLRKEQLINSQKIMMQRFLLILSLAFLLLSIALVIIIYFANKKIKNANFELNIRNNEILLQKETIDQKAQALIEKNKELEGINQIKDKLIAVIAHDLKNPFNNISGYSEIIISQLKKYTQSELLSFLRIIHDNAIKGNMLLDNLLQWSRLQTSTLHFDPIEINLYKLVCDEYFLIQHVANEKDIKILTKINKDIVVFADSNMLKTIIRNLLSNALKFTRREGVITISGKIVNHETIITVNDTGVGIEPKIMGKLFTGEVGVTSANVSGETGTGLGLMLCKDFIDMHKGKIWVESELGKGSTFYISLPNKRY